MKQRKYIQIGIEKYKEFVNNYLQTTPDVAKIINDLYFSDVYSISDWIKSIEGENLNSIRSPLRKQIPPIIATLDKIANVRLPDGFFLEDLNDPYLFFSNRTYENAEAAIRRSPNPYYIFDLGIFEKINSIIVSCLRRDNVRPTSGVVYQRNITNSIILKLVNDQKYTKHSGIEEYEFPEIILEQNQEKYFLFKDSDIGSILLLPGSSFLFFYLESNIPIYDSNNNIIGMERKDDEPIIYDDKGSQKFIVSNSYAKLELYNKYILICVFLYVNLVEAFESWAIKHFDSFISIS